jgi:rhodanese-related sulfurtransferase
MLKTIPELIAEARTELRCIEASLAVAEAQLNGGVLIDVREVAEVQQSPAPHSVNLPRSMLEMIVLEHVKQAETPLYLHCASGVRATLAAEQLLRMGYEQVCVITSSFDQVCAAQRREI